MKIDSPSPLQASVGTLVRLYTRGVHGEPCRGTMGQKGQLNGHFDLGSMAHNLIPRCFC